jgi:peptidoglycan/LPS O-acetylase OafA/YrhL
LPRGDSAASVVDTLAAVKASRPRQLDALTGLGCLTAHLYLHIRERPVTWSEERWSRLALAAALICLFSAGVVFLSRPPFSFHGLVQFLQMNFLCAVPIGALIFCVSRYPTGTSRFLCLGPLVLLGEVSCSIYSVHTWTLPIFIRDPVNYTTLGAVHAVFRVAMGIGLTLILATATYRVIEVPGRAKLRRFFNRSTMALFGPRENNFRGRASGIASCFLVTGSLVLFPGVCLAYQLTR